MPETTAATPATCLTVERQLAKPPGDVPESAWRQVRLGLFKLLVCKLETSLADQFHPFSGKLAGKPDTQILFSHKLVEEHAR